MANMESIKEKWAAFKTKAQPGLEKAGKIAGVTGRVFYWIGYVLYSLRGIFLSLPILYLAKQVRDLCTEKLPETVGLFLQSSGDFAMMMPRDTALQYCLLVTCGCLIMMLLSRKTLYPWLISLFSLVLPLLILLINAFPA
jgi:hypothetical protein